MSFYEVLNAAITDLVEHGYDSQQRLDAWLSKLNDAARRSLVPPAVLQRALQDVLQRVYSRSTGDAKLMKVHSGVSQFTLRSVKPKLRAELDRRILASASLIKLNREASIARTLQRFAGWASSVPAGGTEVGKRKEVKDTVRRGIASLPFEERRVVIDQGHKLVAAINEIVAVDGGAIAAIWRHVNEGGGYQARPVHEKRSGHVYLVRGSWAQQSGYVKPSYGYSDEIEQPGELPFCRCQYQFLYTLAKLTNENLTAKGRKALEDAKVKLKATS